MLPEPVVQLLTAFVDGELSQRQRKAAMRLLHRSSKARELLRQLQENAHKLKRLPRRKLQPSLVPDVLQAIAQQQAQPEPKHEAAPPRAPRRHRGWVPYVAASLAASVLIAALGLLIWSSLTEPEIDSKGQNAPLAKTLNVEKKQEPKSDPPRIEKKIEPITTPGKIDPKVEPKKPDPSPSPTPIPEQVFTASFRDFQSGKEAVTAGQLTYHLNRENVVQLDLKVSKNIEAMERLKTALMDRGFKIIVDPDADKSLARKDKVEYQIYIENLQADEVTAMLKDLAQPSISGTKKEASPYDKLRLTSLPKEQKSKITTMLGIDLGNPNKELKGSEPPERWSRSAVVLPISAQPSVKLREFAEERRRPRADRVQVLLKIH